MSTFVQSLAFINDKYYMGISKVSLALESEQIDKKMC